MARTDASCELSANSEVSMCRTREAHGSRSSKVLSMCSMGSWYVQDLIPCRGGNIYQYSGFMLLTELKHQMPRLDLRMMLAIISFGLYMMAKLPVHIEGPHWICQAATSQLRR